MTEAASDEILARYQRAAPLDEAFLGQLKHALLHPQSPALQDILAMAITAGTGELARLPEADALRQAALGEAPHRFAAEAIERAAIAASINARLQGTPARDKEYYTIWKICSKCMHGNTPHPPGFAPADKDRILRARTLAAEDMTASNEFIALSRYLAAAEDIEGDWDGDPKRVARYRQLIARLEHAAAETGDNQGRRDRAEAASPEQRSAARIAARDGDYFFREEHHAILAMLRRVVGASDPSPAEIAKAERDAERAARPAALLQGVAPVWRESFEWLLDLPYTSDTLQTTLRDEPRLTALAALDAGARGIILSDLARLRDDYPDWKSSAAVAPMQRLDGLAKRSERDAIADAGFTAWTKFDIVAALVVARPVDLGDGDMARLLTAARTWRALCDVALLDSAEQTLQKGPAPQTIAALRALETSPSNVIIPGRAGPLHEGDAWWNLAPARARTLIDAHAVAEPPATGIASLVGRLFGRPRKPGD